MNADTICTICGEKPRATADDGGVVSNMCFECAELVRRLGGVQAALDVTAAEKRKEEDR